MSGSDAGGMPPAEFRRWGYRFIDWVADYLQGVQSYPVLAQVRPGDVREALEPSAPKDGESFETLFEDFREVIVPGITHWNNPSFFGYFAISGSGPGVLGELLVAALNVNAMVWKSSPAATELEEVTLDWMRQFVGLPADFAGAINDTASVSSFHALAAARERHLPEARDKGMSAAPPARVYTTAEAHSSVAKAAIALGFGREGVRTVGTGSGRAMDVAALAEAIDRDIASGCRPVAIVATIGTTSTTAVDPVARIAGGGAIEGAVAPRGCGLCGTGGLASRLATPLRWVGKGRLRCD